MRKETKTCLIGFLGGLVLGWGWYNWPSFPDEYELRTKTACLPDKGLSFKLDYAGRGTAVFHVVPPNYKKEEIQ